MSCSSLALKNDWLNFGHKKFLAFAKCIKRKFYVNLIVKWHHHHSGEIFRSPLFQRWHVFLRLRQEGVTFSWLLLLSLFVYSAMFNKWACLLRNFLFILQPLLLKSKQGGNSYLVPCSLIEDNRVIVSPFLFTAIFSKSQ